MEIYGRIFILGRILISWKIRNRELPGTILSFVRVVAEYHDTMKFVLQSSYRYDKKIDIYKREAVALCSSFFDEFVALDSAARRVI